MINRTAFYDANPRVVAATILTLLFFVSSAHFAGADPPPMVRWEILATVTDVVDPLGLFPDVRLGDPVHGMLKYDTSLFPNPLFSGTGDHYFTNDTWIDVTRMTIENPRTGGAWAFQTDVDGDYADVEVFNDYAVNDVLFDGFYAPQSVLPPVGYQGQSPVVAVYLEGPTTIFTDPPRLPIFSDRPPTALDLNDWPVAALVFWDAYAEDPSATGIEAEIYSLRLITELQSPGDFDFDGSVDAADFYGWNVTYGDHTLLYADGNGDDVVDAADYTVWRDHKGLATGNSAISQANVPEPAAIVVVALAAYGSCRHRRRLQLDRSQFGDSRSRTQFGPF